MGEKTTPAAIEPKSADALFIAAVEAIYDAAPDPSLWPRTLQKIADCLGDVGAILIWRRDDGGFGTVVSPALVEAQRDYEDNQWYLRDLPSQRVVERALWLRGGAVTDHDAVSDEEMRTHPFYTEFCAKHGLRWHASVGVAPDSHISVWVAMQRSGRKEGHSGAELTTLTRLGGHVEKSLRLSIRLLDAELANVGLGDALTRLGIGVFVLDSLGRAVFSNPTAQHLLGKYVEIVDGRLRLGVGEDRAIADVAMTQMLRVGVENLVTDPKPILLHRVPPERPLVMYLLPVTPRQSMAEQFLTNTRAIALVIEPKTNEPADPAVVRDVLGLTLGEARVAALIATGMAPRQASERLGITNETARTVLKRIYGKVGVSRQSELAAMLSRLALNMPGA